MMLGACWLLALAAQGTAAAEIRVGQTAPPLEECEWVQGTTGSGAGKVVRKIGGDGSVPIDPADLERAIGQLGAPDLAEMAGRVVIVHAFDSHDSAMISGGLRLLHELAQANDDRGLGVITLCAKDDADSAKTALGYVGMTSPLGAVEGESTYFSRAGGGVRTAFVVGRSGELVWKGDVVADPKGLCAAVTIALVRRAAPRIERTLAVALEPTLSDYWNGRFEKARKSLDKITRSARDDAELASDCELLRSRIDAHERDLLQRVKQAAAAQNVAALADLEEVLGYGFDRPSSRAATEALDELAGKTLEAGAVADERAWRELSRSRPLFFPARNDTEGARYAKQIEKFLRTTQNSIPATQQARKLLRAFQSLP